MRLLLKLSAEYAVLNHNKWVLLSRKIYEFTSEWFLINRTVSSIHNTLYTPPLMHRRVGFHAVRESFRENAVLSTLHERCLQRSVHCARKEVSMVSISYGTICLTRKYGNEHEMQRNLGKELMEMKT